MLHQKIVENPYKAKYGNFIGGEWREPVSGRYFVGREERRDCLDFGFR